MRSLILLAALLVSGVAEATPRHRLVHDSLTAIRYNPLGLQQYYNVAYQYRLFDSDSMLFDDTYIRFGPNIVASPAFMKGGAQLMIKPMAMLELTAIYRYQYFLGTFNQVIGFPDPANADWSDTNLGNNGDQAIAVGGHQVVLQAREQAAVGPIALRNTTRFVYNSMDLEPGDVAYYDQTPDMLVPNKGWLIVNDADGIYLAGKLKAGVRWTWTAPRYGDGAKAENQDSHRVGPLIAYEFRNQPGAAMANPTLLLLTQWHIVHPYRTGQDVSTAIPYVALAFTFNGDLIPWKENKPPAAAPPATEPEPAAPEPVAPEPAPEPEPTEG